MKMSTNSRIFSSFVVPGTGMMVSHGDHEAKASDMCQFDYITLYIRQIGFMEGIWSRESRNDRQQSIGTFFHFLGGHQSQAIPVFTGLPCY
jgi:hypothetical protein